MHSFLLERMGEERSADNRHLSCHLMGHQEGLVYYCSEGYKNCMNWKAKGGSTTCPVFRSFYVRRVSTPLICTVLAPLLRYQEILLEPAPPRTLKEQVSFSLLPSLPFLIQANLLSCSLWFWLLALKPPSLSSSLPSPSSWVFLTRRKEGKQDFAVNSKRVLWH